jgi:hypothetical protein
MVASKRSTTCTSLKMGSCTVTTGSAGVASHASVPVHGRTMRCLFR